MPLVDTNIQATWDFLYENQVEGETLHFTRRAKRSIYGDDIKRLADALGLTPTRNIVVVGGGFGWGAEDLMDYGVKNVVVTDTSAWIQQNKKFEATLPILNEDSRTEASRARVLAALGTTPDFVISEDVLPILTDDECRVFCTAMRQLGGQVVHWAMCGTGYAQLNWKTAEEWKALVAPDLVVARGTGAVL